MFQICAVTVLPSMPSRLIDRVANSIPMVDLELRLNVLSANRDETARPRISLRVRGGGKVIMYLRLLTVAGNEIIVVGRVSEC